MNEQGLFADIFHRGILPVCFPSADETISSHSPPHFRWSAAPPLPNLIDTAVKCAGWILEIRRKNVRNWEFRCWTAQGRRKNPVNKRLSTNRELKLVKFLWSPEYNFRVLDGGSGGSFFLGASVELGTKQQLRYFP